MSLPEFNTTSYRFLCDFISEHAGIELGPDRQYLVESRLEPVLMETQHKSLADLCRALIRENETPATKPLLKRKIIHALSTHETSFFRDPELFKILRTEILPALLASSPTGQLKLWSAAASSGQEAYSLGILFAEMGIHPLPLLIATDISAIVLEIAEAGIYTNYELMRGMEDPVLRKKYFTPLNGGAQVNPEIRNCVKFLCCDLRDTQQNFGPLDMILCRNVFIYFDEPTRQRVLEHLLSQLRPGGVLILGSAEAIWNDFPCLSRRNAEGFSYYVKSAMN
jgi:chemotaxis protein methyltransferase CheR